MKKRHLLLTLLLALFVPWAANAQMTATATCYPPSEEYATGYTSSTAKTSGQLYVQSAGGNRGWMKFDVSAIPDDATITSITLKFYYYQTSFPYVYATAAGELNPTTASASDLFSAIGHSSPTYYTIKSKHRSMNKCITLSFYTKDITICCCIRNWKSDHLRTMYSIIHAVLNNSINSW